MSIFPFPTLTLSHGPWRVEVADVRGGGGGAGLGARFVHGGYISECWYGDRCLTSNPLSHWDPWFGQGLPEVFESSLGWGGAAMGEEYLRIGSGRLRRVPGPADETRYRELSQAVTWRLLAHTPNSCTWRCQDSVEIGGERLGYRLQRQLCLGEQGLLSSTELWLDCPWQQPLIWFPHPFFAQRDGAGSRFLLPAERRIADHRGPWRFPPAGGLNIASGAWGQPATLAVELDQRLGGGLLEMQAAYPVDKVVLWANERSSAAEPYFARAWHRREQGEWSIRYRFFDRKPLA